MRINKEKVRNILIIKFRALGDILLSVPAMRAVRESFPEAKICILVNKGGEEILSGQGLADELLVFDKNNGLPVARDLDLILSIMDRKFDLVIDMYGNLRSALLACLSGAVYRVGLSSRFRKIFYNIIVEGPAEIIYNAEVWLRVAAAAGAVTSDKRPAIELGSEAEKYISGFLKESGLEGKKYAVLNPFASAPTREWPRSGYIELANRLGKYGLTSVIAWGPGQKKAAIEIAGASGKNTLTAPETGIKQLGWLLKKSAVVVTGTTFIQHLAVAAGANVVSIFGATDCRAWVDPAYLKQTVLQARLDCMPCEKVECGNFRCMENITASMVEAAVRKHAGIV